jgi:hypothetical protein
MKEYKSIEVMNNSQTQIHQDSRLYNQSRMSKQKDSCNCGNNDWKWFQLMKEYKSIEAMNNKQMQIHQDSRLYNNFQRSE